LRRRKADVPPDLDNASPEDLNELVQSILERVNALERENTALRDEIAQLLYRGGLSQHGYPLGC
jgi:hypothetical protein